MQKNSPRSPKSTRRTPPTITTQSDQLLLDIRTEARQLIAELEDGASDRFIAFLKFCAQFPAYSVRNTMLIRGQAPLVCYVASESEWNKKGYHVTGSQKIWIFAPAIRKEEDQTTGKEKTRVYFVTVPVVDASQLDPAELAERPLMTLTPALESDEESEACYQRVVTCMAAQSIQVQEVSTLPYGVDGLSTGGIVCLRAGMDSKNRLFSAIHEWGHEILHQGKNRAAGAKLTKEQREYHAEATAYIVCARLRIHHEFAVDYLRSYALTPRKFLKELTLIQKAASVIIRALEPNIDQAAEDDVDDDQEGSNAA